MPRKSVTEKEASCTGATVQADAVVTTPESDATTEPDVTTEPDATTESDATTEPDVTTEPDATESTDVLEPEEEMQLVAVLPILFESHQYAPGDVLPTHNSEMRELWLEGGAASWMPGKSKNLMRAQPIAALSGVSGLATPASAKEDLVGRLPWSAQREKA